VLAYELLTGRLPHRRAGRGMAEMASAKLSEEIARPSTAVLEGAREGTETTTAGEPRAQRRLARALAGDLDTIVMTALRREPERRYPSVAALAEDLQRFLEGRPIHARPDSLGYRVGKFLRRHRLGVLAATLAVLSLVAGMLVALWQAGRAQEAAAAARAEAAKSDAIATFLTDVFTAADPEGKQAADLTARELVSRGAERIGDELAEQPATRAAMLHVLGTVQFRLGQYEPARELLEKALAARRSLQPPAPADVAKTAAVLGVVLHRQGSSAEGVALLEEARAFHEGAGEDAVPDLARDLNNLANGYKALDRNDEARAAFERAIALLESGHPGITPDQLPRTLNNYGLFLDRLREHAAARAALERALALHERNSGPDSALVSATLSNLSDLYVRVGEVDQARAAAERALAIATTTYGPDHYDTGLALNSVGWTLLKGDRPADAAPYFERAITVLGVAVGDQHRATAYALRNLGSALVRIGREEEGLAALRRAEDAFTASVGADSHEVASVLVELGPVLAARGDLAEGERQVARAVELWRGGGLASRRAVGGGWSALARLRLAGCDAAGAQAALAQVETEAAAYPDAEWARTLRELRAEVAAGPPPSCARRG
jgi:serine/threonine-protein kinase